MNFYLIIVICKSVLTKQHIVAVLLKAIVVKPLERPVARQWLNACHVVAATDTHTTTEKLLETVFSVRSVPRTSQ
jgi:hypothetical protein